MTICNAHNQRSVANDSRWLGLNSDFWQLASCLSHCTAQRFAAAVGAVYFIDLPAQVSLSLRLFLDRLYAEHTSFSHKFYTGAHFTLLIGMETAFMLLIDLTPIKV